MTSHAWNKKHIIQKIRMGSKYDKNGNTITYRIIERRYISALEARITPDGITALKRHDYKQRGRQSRRIEMFILKHDI